MSELLLLFEEIQTEIITEKFKLEQKNNYGSAFGEHEITYIPTVNLYTDTNLTTLWNGKFVTATSTSSDILLNNFVGVVTLKNPTPTPVLWKDFGYIDNLGNSVTDTVVSLDGVTYTDKVDVFLNGEEAKQVWVKFIDTINSRTLTLNKKLRG